MSIYWNGRVQNLSPYVPGEQPRDRKFIKLNTNENPYPPSPRVIGAISNTIAAGKSAFGAEAAGARLRLYPDPACTELREAIAARYKVKPEQVFAGNGSDEVLAFAFAAFFESAAGTGSAAPDAAAGANAAAALPVLFPDITYSFYPVYAGLWDVPFRALPLGEDFSIGVDDYTIPCGGVIFPNPNAPTGLALPLSSILSIAEAQRKNNSVVIVDEAYIAFANTPGVESAVPCINDHPNLLTVHTLSKSASLAGLRIGFAIGNEELIEGLCRIRDSFNSYTLDRLALAGAAAAVSDAPYYDNINRRVIATRDRVSAALSAQGFDVVPSSANFIFVRFPNKTGEEAFAALREKGILVRHFNKKRIAEYLRVSIGTDAEMDSFLSACEKITGAANYTN
ncbi:histidinol-phosphate aminotransferase [Spirochaetia bacterium]|nr:histidinol-phosphate aminotransferase [Spirochaetia bacterium]